jgi:uncharacterized protein (TIGR03000 family)
VDGRILGATAKHLFTNWGGVSPPLNPADLSRDLMSWTVSPRGAPGEAVALKKLAVPASVLGRATAETPDWVFMTTGLSEDELPGNIRPLLVRQQPVARGEKIFVLGVPYNNPPHPRQNVYTGEVTNTGHHTFLYRLHQGVDTKGFSGAPILDARGYVIGTIGTAAAQAMAIAPVAGVLEGGKSRPQTHKEPTGPGKKEPSTPGKKEPSTPGKKEPSTPGKKEPSTPGKKEPSTPGKKEPSTPGAARGLQPARIVVRLPAAASLWIGGDPTRSKSSRREFVTPPLSAGRTYRYDLRAELTEGGSRRTVRTSVAVRAGQRSSVEIRFPAGQLAAR